MLRTVLVVSAFLAVAPIALNQHVHEVTSYRIHPTAEKALALGEKHFSSRNSSLYDIRKAAAYFREAYTLDPDYEYLNHELSRVAFLQGNFYTAMYFINREIELRGETSPNSFYVRGLIKGYMGDYVSSAKDYERYLESNPNNWAALNDYAWVLLKARRFADAATATQKGLEFFPENPWLLNSSATALYELGQYEEALNQVTKAQAAVSKLSETQWLTAYPGNDPKIAAEGISAFKKAVEDNIHTITMKLASSKVQ